MDPDIAFDDEAAPDDTQAPALQPWHIMIVDDDPSVHEVTQLVLSNFEFDQRPLHFTNCYSATEARATLATRSDVALILLDVVMESEHAGLDLVKHIRNDLRNKHVRIVLRTGQAGQAPEEEVIRSYDINDYKEKTELTARKMVTAFYSALRSYRDIMLIENSRRGLRRSIEAITRVYDSHNLRSFASTVLEQLNLLLGIHGHGICASRTAAYAASSSDGRLKILAVTKEYEELHINIDVAHLPHEVKDAFDRALMSKAGFCTDHIFVGYYNTRLGSESVIYMSFAEPISHYATELLEIFSANIAITYENLLLREEMHDAQRTTIFILSEAIERLSTDAGAHVRRVSELSALLAGCAGLPVQEIEFIRQAAPLHDVGKIGIPDLVLNKAGKLDREEWEVMQTHARLGFDLLNQSDQLVLQMGAIIANEHHEKWDGSGYPRGLTGEQIHIAGRIAAVADVLDSLASKRCYKDAWSLDDAMAYIKSESGKHFDPMLVEHLFNQREAVMDIYARQPD